MEKMLNKAEAEALFEREAILLGEGNVIPYYRIAELFGEQAVEFIDKHQRDKGYLVGGRDWNGIGSCEEGRRLILYLYKAGFLKIVTERNYLLIVKAHRNSEGGQLVDKYSKERSRRLKG